MTVKRLMLLAVVALGCNYYGPDNPPPAPPAPAVFNVKLFQTQVNDSVVSAACPAGSVITGGGCDCVWCSPAGTPAIFGCNVFGNTMVAGCYGPCVGVHILCMSSSKAGTLTQGLGEPDPEAVAAMYQWREQLGGNR